MVANLRQRHLTNVTQLPVTVTVIPVSIVVDNAHVCFLYVAWLTSSEVGKKALVRRLSNNGPPFLPEQDHMQKEYTVLFMIVFDN